MFLKSAFTVIGILAFIGFCGWLFNRAHPWIGIGVGVFGIIFIVNHFINYFSNNKNQ
jgi:4-hydroxybenzoate polyprenyltransferase